MRRSVYIPIAFLLLFSTSMALDNLAVTKKGSPPYKGGVAGGRCRADGVVLSEIISADAMVDRGAVENHPVSRARPACHPSFVRRGAFVSFPTSVDRAKRDVDIASIERTRVITAADQYLKEKPITITASSSRRSAGGKHDFFSEGDYWWPDPKNPDGPYIQKDGMSNPDNFVEHRRALMRFSVQVPALTAAWVLTGKRAYANKAAEHLRAWFVTEDTRMNPNLQYAQAIHGITTGRGTGVIDTIHFVEVARAIEVLEKSGALTKADLSGIKGWFSEYLTWLTTSKNGTDERDAKNNHGTCWVMQVAAFAHLTRNTELMHYCRDRFRTVIVPNQIEKDGRLPQELRRTKPYNYSLFNLEAMTAICQILSTPKDDLWKFKTADGRGVAGAVAYMYPFIKDKKTWTKPADVMYFDQWPMRQSSLLFAGLALGHPEYIETWTKLPADSSVEETIRNFFIRQPIVWVGNRASKS